MNSGKIPVDIIPIFKPICSGVINSFSARRVMLSNLITYSDTVPQSQEPMEQPMSPKSARNPYIAVDAVVIFLAEKEYTPGHIMLTVKPVTAQVIRAKN